MEAEESAEEEGDDPFAASSEPTEDADGKEPEATDSEDDPFADDSSGDDAADEDSEPTEDEPVETADEDESAPEPDEDDPFGDFGGVSPRPMADAVARAPSRTSAGPPLESPASQLFFAVGKWIGSRGQSPSNSERGGADRSAAGVVQADFELGPADEIREEVPATAQLPAEADPFADDATPEDDSVDEVDPFSDF